MARTNVARCIHGTALSRKCASCRERDASPIDGHDIDGWPYVLGEHYVDGAMRLSKCCHAAVTFHDADLCCKRCWNFVDGEALSPARFDGNWNPGDGAVRVVLADLPNAVIGKPIASSTRKLSTDVETLPSDVIALRALLKISRDRRWRAKRRADAELVATMSARIAAISAAIAGATS